MLFVMAGLITGGSDSSTHTSWLGLAANAEGERNSATAVPLAAPARKRRRETGDASGTAILRDSRPLVMDMAPFDEVEGRSLGRVFDHSGSAPLRRKSKRGRENGNGILARAPDHWAYPPWQIQNSKKNLTLQGAPFRLRRSWRRAVPLSAAARWLRWIAPGPSSSTAR